MTIRQINLRKLLLGLSALSWLAGCQSNQAAEFGEFQKFDPMNYEGVWASKGYGEVIEFFDGGLRVYGVTEKSCVAEPEDVLSGPHFLDRMKISADGQTMRATLSLDPYEYEYERIDSLNALCSEFSADTQLGNFDAFVDYFDTHYAFFDLFGVNWQARSTLAREQVSETTSDIELFEILETLIAPLADSHLGIDAEIDGVSYAYDANPGITETALANFAQRNEISERQAIGEFRQNFWYEGIEKTLLGSNSHMAANNRIQYGMASGKTAYMAVVTMGGYLDGKEGSLPEEGVVINNAMDEILTFFAQNKAEDLILDLSMNSGGYDFVALQIADRFVPNGEITAFRKKAYDWPDSTPFDFKLGRDPGKIRFNGHVYLMVSDLTVSAGEMVPLALRGLDHVTVLGQPTRGAFSTVLNKYLPNGWVFSISNEIYSDRDGKVWEGLGIPPDIELTVFDKENPNKGHVEAVQYAIKLAEKP